MYSKNEDVLKLALIKHGPIAISIQVTLSSFLFYSDGVYYDEILSKYLHNFAYFKNTLKPVTYF